MYHKGKSVLTGQQVAIKVVDLKRIETKFDATLLKNEILTQKALNHPNIVQVFDQLMSSNRVYIITEYCESGNLFNWINQHGRVAEQDALRILLQIVKAVNHIHSKNILHRDIKSANILLKNNFTVKLADFGFASFMMSQPNTRYTVGSPVYMSPEHFLQNQNSIKCDTWGIGMIFYEMLMGFQPFAHSNMNEVYSLIQSGKIF